MSAHTTELRYIPAATHLWPPPPKGWPYPVGSRTTSILTAGSPYYFILGSPLIIIISTRRSPFLKDLRVLYIFWWKWPRTARNCTCATDGKVCKLHVHCLHMAQNYKLITAPDKPCYIHNLYDCTHRWTRNYRRNPLTPPKSRWPSVTLSSLFTYYVNSECWFISPIYISILPHTNYFRV